MKTIRAEAEHDGRLSLVSINLDQDVESARRYLANLAVPGTPGYAGGWAHSSLLGEYGVRKLPSAVLVGPEGTILARDLSGPALRVAVQRALGVPSKSEDGAWLTITAQEIWVPSNRVLAAGDEVTIRASGTWSHGHQGDLGYAPFYGADGYHKSDAEVLLPSANVGALVGRIGTGEPFLIGKSARFVASQSGELFLAMNERPNALDHANNEGQVLVKLTVKSQ